MSEPKRPLLRYHGGKWRLAPWIISHFPKHRIYVEPFGGGGSVLLRKPRSYAEVYNDLDDEVVDLFKVMRDPDMALRLIEQLRMTPFARTEYESATPLPADDIIEVSRKLIIRSFMGFGSDAHSRRNPTGFRANSNKSGTAPAHDWANYPDCMDAMIDRLIGVVIENRDAMAVMTAHDSHETLHYLDPPYVHATRAQKKPKNYRFEMSDADHVALIESAKALAGMVIISGYPSQLYDDHLSGWKRVNREALADGARKRTECLWLNRRAVDALEAMDMFDRMES